MSDSDESVQFRAMPSGLSSHAGTVNHIPYRNDNTTAVGPPTPDDDGTSSTISFHYHPQQQSLNTSINFIQQMTQRSTTAESRSMSMVFVPEGGAGGGGGHARAVSSISQTIPPSSRPMPVVSPPQPMSDATRRLGGGASVKPPTTRPSGDTSLMGGPSSPHHPIGGGGGAVPSFAHMSSTPPSPLGEPHQSPSATMTAGGGGPAPPMMTKRVLLAGNHNPSSNNLIHNNNNSNNNDRIAAPTHQQQHEQQYMQTTLNASRTVASARHQQRNDDEGGPRTPTPSPAHDRDNTAGAGDGKIFMNIYSNIFDEVQFRKMAPDTKFSRLLKSLLIASRDEIREKSRQNSTAHAASQSPPPPPPPLSAGDLYFKNSGTIVDVNATPRQYGIDTIHMDEDNGLELVFKYHPLGGDVILSGPPPMMGTAATTNTTTADVSAISTLDRHLKRGHSPERANIVAHLGSESPVRGRQIIGSLSPPASVRARPPPPTHVPNRASPRNSSPLRGGMPPAVPRHRSPQNNKSDVQSLASTGTSSFRQQHYQHTAHWGNSGIGVISANISHHTSSLNHGRDTPMRRSLAHEPRTAQQSIPSTSLRQNPWPNEIPFKATLAANPPHLTNRSAYSQRLKNGAGERQQFEGISSTAEGKGRGPSGRPPSTTASTMMNNTAVSAFAQSNCSSTQNMSVVATAIPRGDSTKAQQSARGSELEMELEKALNLLATKHNGKPFQKPTTHLEDTDEEDDEFDGGYAAHVSARAAMGPPRPIQADNADITNYHAQLMQQLKIDRLRQSQQTRFDYTQNLQPSPTAISGI